MAGSTEDLDEVSDIVMERATIRVDLLPIPMVWEDSVVLVGP